MKLEEALKEAVKLEGKEILTSSRLVPILDDLGAFKDEKCYKNILRTFISEGYMQKNIVLDEVDIDKFTYIVASNTGFQNNLIKKVCIDICRINGKTLDYDIQDVNSILKQESQFSDTILRKKSLTSTSSWKDIEKYLTSIFYIDYKSFKRKRIKTQGLPNLHYPGWCYFEYEIEGMSYPTEYAFLNLYYYDKNGFLRYVDFLDDVELKEDSSVDYKTGHLSRYIPVQEIGKLILRADSNTCINHVFEKEKESILQYKNEIKYELTKYIINEIQILGISKKDESKVSFYLNFRFKDDTFTNIKAIIFDKVGNLIQSFVIMDAMYEFEEYLIYKTFDKNDDYFYISNDEVIKISFDKIGKIVITEE